MYDVSTFARKYAPTGSGVIRSCRVQPAWRSPEIRAPMDWFPRLLAAKETELRKWKLLDQGARIHFSELREDVWVSTLLKP